MSTYVVDASIAVKWVVDEDGTPNALALRKQSRLIAPELLLVECANVFWKKVQRAELTPHEAVVATRLLRVSGVELVGTPSLIEATTELAIELVHPAYDCIYLALALERGCKFVTADERLLRKVTTTKKRSLRDTVLRLP